MNQLNSDGNLLGRIGAIALLAAAGFGFHRLSCDAGICPVMKTDSCCSGLSEQASAEAPEAAPHAVPAK